MNYNANMLFNEGLHVTYSILIIGNWREKQRKRKKPLAKDFTGNSSLEYKRWGQGFSQTTFSTKRFIEAANSFGDINVI